jgi:sugar lactone lactonase YvrE
MSADAAVPVVFVDGLAFAEGPRWYKGALWVSDMHQHQVLKIDESGVSTVVLVHDSPVSGLGWTPEGQLLTAAMDGFLLCDGEPFADVRALAPFGINDMITHPAGWSWVGQFGYDRHSGGRPAPSSLLRVDVDGHSSVAADGLLVANGMAITADGHTLLVAESAGLRISAFTVGDDGSLHGRRTYAEVPPPDGMCLDAEGAVWVAGVTSGAFFRVAEGGAILQTVEVAKGRRPIACVLGGSDRQTLYLLTATTRGEADASTAAMASRIEQLSVTIPGVGWP